MKILIVDDNILDRKYLKYLLESHLHVYPLTAKDGLDALNKLQSSQFDLVITDIVMPKIEGIELISQIKSLSPNTDIIAISGQNPYYLHIVNKMGVDNVYTKPVDTHNFLDKVKTILNKHSNQLSC